MTAYYINNLKNSLKKGFTLIELLIVIAILGTLAVVVLLALNPVQQLARTRDAGRISGVTQLGHNLEAFGTSNGGIYVNDTPAAGSNCVPLNWIGCLISSGELSSAPSAITYSAGPVACVGTGGAQVNGWCYNSGAAGAGPVVVYARLESLANNNRCAAATPWAYAVYSSADSRGGIVCRAAGAASEPVPGIQNPTFLP